MNFHIKKKNLIVVFENMNITKIIWDEFYSSMRLYFLKERVENRTDI